MRFSLLSTSIAVGGVLGAVLYVVIAVSDDHEIRLAFLTGCIVAGSGTGLIILEYIKAKGKNVGLAEKLSTVKLAAVESYSFLGIGVGMLVGVLLSWLFVYPFSALFGYPFTEGSAHQTRTNMFVLCAAAITIACSFLMGRFFLMQALGFLVRRFGQETGGRAASLSR